MKFLHRLIRAAESLSERSGRVVSWLTALLVLMVCYDVFTRYFLKTSTVAVQELEWHLFSLIFLLGAAYTLKRDLHVRVDVLYQRLGKKGQAWVDLLGTLLFLLPFSLLVVITSRPFVANSFAILEGSPDPGGLPWRFMLKSAIPAGFVLVLIQGLAQAGRALTVLLERNPEQRRGNDG